MAPMFSFRERLKYLNLFIKLINFFIIEKIRKDFIEIMLDSETTDENIDLKSNSSKKISNNEIIASALTFMSGAFATTGSAFNYIILSKGETLCHFFPINT